MSLMLAERFDVEDVFWARPLPLSCDDSDFRSCGSLESLSVSALGGAPVVTALRAWHRPFVGAFSDRFCAL